MEPLKYIRDLDGQRRKAETKFHIPESLTDEILENLHGPLIPLATIVAMLSETALPDDERAQRAKRIINNPEFARSAADDAIIYANIAKRQCAAAALLAWARDLGRAVLYRTDNNFCVIPIDPIELSFSRNIGHEDGSLELDHDRLTDDQWNHLWPNFPKWHNVQLEREAFLKFVRPQKLAPPNHDNSEPDVSQSGWEKASDAIRALPPKQQQILEFGRSIWPQIADMPKSPGQRRHEITKRWPKEGYGKAPTRNTIDTAFRNADL
jgi:hypothetical protein